MPEDKKSDLKQAKVVDVPTQFGEGIELPDGKTVGLTHALVYVINQLEIIKRAVA